MLLDWLLDFVVIYAEIQKAIKIAEIHFWPKKMAQKLPKNDPKVTQMAQKLPKMAQKLAPAKKNSRDISPVSPPFCISVVP